jgi:hypothetical protein
MIENLKIKYNYGCGITPGNLVQSHYKHKPTNQYLKSESLCLYVGKLKFFILFKGKERLSTCIPLPHLHVRTEN